MSALSSRCDELGCHQVEMVMSCTKIRPVKALWRKVFSKGSGVVNMKSTATNGFVVYDESAKVDYVCIWTGYVLFMTFASCSLLLFLTFVYLALTSHFS